MTNENKIIAYKGFDKDFKCRDFQYKVGETYKMDGNIACCNRGFHDMDDSITTFGRIRIINSVNLGDSYDFINWH